MGLCTCVHATYHTCYYCVHRHCSGFPHVHIAQLYYQVLTMCLHGVWLNSETRSKFCCCDKISTRLTWGNHGLLWLLVGRHEVRHGREDREAGVKGACWHFIHRREAERNECYCTSGLFVRSPCYSVWVPSSCLGYVFPLHLNPIGKVLKDCPECVL